MKAGSGSRRVLLVAGSILLMLILLAWPGYYLARATFNHYFRTWGSRLVELESRNLLSRQYGAAWQDILATDSMHTSATRITGKADSDEGEGIRIVDGIPVNGYPSLRIVRELNRVHHYANTLLIEDRRGLEIARINTDHARVQLGEVPEVLLTALIAAEDGNFYTNPLGFEFDSYVRAALQAAWRSLTRFTLVTPRGTSTITQQVAKLLISALDDQGRRIVKTSLDRKVREMRVAAALRQMYTPQEILEVYVNHCVTSDYGLIGYGDIARGLFHSPLDDLSDAQCIYLARMVKWGRNLRAKIITQCRVDMPRMGAALGWNTQKQERVLAAFDTLSFSRPRQIYTAHGALVDLANHFWLLTLQKRGVAPERVARMDIIDPNSLLRKKGNLTIRLNIDRVLQEEVERLVANRGFGGDTVITTDIRIGSHGEEVRLSSSPRDTLRQIEVLSTPRSFSEPGSAFRTTLASGDTLITNIRYRRLGGSRFRRSLFFYRRGPLAVDGQYFAYALMDARTGQLVAYHSRDKIGSRCACLLRNRTPNGSSTAKPIFNALNFDWENFAPYQMWSDCTLVHAPLPWQRSFVYEGGRPVGVAYRVSAVPGKPYEVHNHGDVLEGCNFVFEHLSTSNNILGVETVYRLNRRPFLPDGRINPHAIPMVEFLRRVNAFGRIKEDQKIDYVTGVRVYKELVRIAGVDADSMTAFGRRIAVSDSLFSVGLGTLELTLYQQLHLFNVLYQNNLIENPHSHPSLVIRSIVLNGDTLGLRDTVRRYHPFNKIASLRPTWLGMHKRLISNHWDGLGEYDIALDRGTTLPGTTFSKDALLPAGPVANFAKSGTTDDVIRPFNVDVTSRRRTNYGLWNAVIRLDLARLRGSNEPVVRDIAVTCIGECNRHYTGPRDGKSLHKYLTRALLKKAGTKVENGYFSHYEAFLRRTIPDSARTCDHVTPGPQTASPPPALPKPQEETFRADW